MTSHRSSPMTVFFLIAIVCSAALAQSIPFPQPEDVVRSESADPVPLRNWIPAIASQLPQPSEERIATMALPSAASHFIALNPCRVVDTRDPNGTYGGPMLSGGVSRIFNITSGPCAGIPAAAAYSLNIAVTGSEPGAIQFLTAFPAGTIRPQVATMNFDGGETTSNAALVPASAAGAIQIYASTDTHLIVDVNGYIKEGVVTSLTAGVGLAGGGTGTVSLSVADGGVGAAQLGASAVTAGAIQDGAVTGAKIANSQVVRSLKGLSDAVDILGTGGATVTTIGSTISIDTSAIAPTGTMILGSPNDTTLIGAGYTELGPGMDHWQVTATTGAPSGRTSHTALWSGTKMIIWGGTDGVNVNTGGQYDPTADSWSATTTIDAPSVRSSHAAVWSGTKMIVWGGTDGPNRQNTGGQYDPVGNSWSATTTSGAPLARLNHTAVWSGTKMIVWGGSDGFTPLNTGGQYDPSGNSWSTTTTTGAPSARQLHTAIWTGTKMIVWGGIDVGNANTGGLYDPTANGWFSTTTTGAPSERVYHTAVWSGTKMIVWGGFDGTELNTGGQYDPAANFWNPTTPSGAPSGRRWHTAVWSGTKMIVWGGNDGTSAFVNTGGQYDPAGNTWSATTISGAPTGREFHTTVWSGTKMIVWGGFDGTSRLNTGGRWAALSLYRKN